jgi:hypothetical protein
LSTDEINTKKYSHENQSHFSVNMLISVFPNIVFGGSVYAIPETNGYNHIANSKQFVVTA